MPATSSSRRTRCSLLVALLIFLHGQSQAADSLETIGDKLTIAAALAQYSYRWDGKDAAGFAVVRSSGIYRNSWRKTESGWLISKRVLFTDSFAPR